MTPIDLELFLLINASAHTSPWFIAAAGFASDHLPDLLMLLLAGAAAKWPALRRSIWTALVSLLMVWLVVRLFRDWMPMPRPASLGLGVQWLPQGARPGFPSMHAAGAFAVAVAVLRTGSARWGAAFLGAAVLIALSRVYLGLHFPADIVIGALLGSLVALVGSACTGLGRPAWLRAPARARAYAYAQIGLRLAAAPSRRPFRPSSGSL